MNIKESSLTLQQMLKGAEDRCYPDYPEGSSAEAYFVPPGKEIELWNNDSPNPDSPSAMAITSFCGSLPELVKYGRSLAVESRYLLESYWCRLSAGTVVMQRMNLTAGQNPNPALNHIRYYVCAEYNDWGFPSLPD